MLSDMAAGLVEVNNRVAKLDAEIRVHARRDADMQRLMAILGVGPTIATDLVATIGDGSSFNKARPSDADDVPGLRFVSFRDIHVPFP